MSFVLERMTDKTFHECVDFLRLRERRCVTLTSYFAVDGKPRYNTESIADAFIVFADKERRAVTGVIARTTTGILLHCLDFSAGSAGAAGSAGIAGAAGALDSLKPAITRVIGQQSIRCVLGSTDGTCFLEDAMPRHPYRVVDYTLMLSDSSRDAATLPLSQPNEGKESISFVRCAPGDEDALLSLQEGYEREEVVPPGDPFDRTACRAILARSLSRQALYAARVDGGYVAKAGTNARGFAWDQLGGVYTAPEWRGRGIARALVSHVVRERRAKGRSVALFVKNANTTARKVYEDTGFSADSPFRISYF